MSHVRGHNNNKNAKKNAREQRLQFMNNQAALIAQRKKEIEEKLAQEQNPKSIVSPAKEESNNTDQESSQSSVKVPPLPFKNDGSFLEQFRKLQQQTQQTNNTASSTSADADANQLPFDIPPPPPSSSASQPSVDVTIPPPCTFAMQNMPQYHIIPPPPPPPLKQEVKREARSPSPYSPSRPCEDDDDQPFTETKVSQLDLHQPGSSHSSQDTGDAPQSSHNVDLKRKIKQEPEDDDESKATERERKRQSRWAPQDVKCEPGSAGLPTGSGVHQSVLARSTVLSRITSADPQILQYAVKVFGTTDLTEDQWKQCMDQVKMQYVYQEMLRKKQERERLEQQNKFKYEYDSDEDTEGGTWEHKRRMVEMEKTRNWAEQLTEHARGKHHIGDFLPPEELSKFMDKYRAVQEGRNVDDSDYNEFKIAESNVGYQMLKKFGWTEGQGLGSGGSGITAPVSAGRQNEKQGLGVIRPDDLTNEDDEYDAYRKRMMLAYRFRPNPLNNPRRTYY